MELLISPQRLDWLCDKQLLSWCPLQYAGHLPVFGGASHQLVSRASTATAAAKKQVAAFTAVQENIQEKELHVEASESYLAVRLVSNHPVGLVVVMMCSV